MKGRQRGRNNNGGKPRMHHQGGGGGGQQRNFDHNAGRMRGNAQQLLDKYLALARDASQQGDRVLAENYFQHADHYYRVVNARFEGQQNNNQQRRFNGPGQGQYDGQDGQGNYQDYNNGSDNHMGPGPSQNLLPQSVGQQSGGDSQPHVQNQPQQGYQQQPQQQYQQPQQSHGQGQHNQSHHGPDQHSQHQQGQGQHSQGHDDGDIGLPPTLFGGDAAPQGNQAESSNSADAPAAGGERPERGSRPRQGTRRRFGPRREGQPRTPAEPADAG